MVDGDVREEPHGEGGSRQREAVDGQILHMPAVCVVAVLNSASADLGAF